MKLMKVLVAVSALALMLPAFASADTIYVDEYLGSSTGAGTGVGSIVTHDSVADTVTGAYVLTHAWTSTVDLQGNLWVEDLGADLYELPSAGSVTSIRSPALNQYSGSPYQMAIQQYATSNPTIFLGNSSGGSGEVAAIFTTGLRGTSIKNSVAPQSKGNIYGVAVDQAGNLYGVTVNRTYGSSNALVELPSGYTSSQAALWIGSNGTFTQATTVLGVFFQNSGVNQDLRMFNPDAIAFDPQQNMWVANKDAYNGRESLYTNYGTDVGNWGITEFTGSATSWAPAGTDVVQLDSALVDANGSSYVSDIQFDSEGDLWVLTGGGVTTTLYEIANPTLGTVYGPDQGNLAATIVLTGVDANYFSILDPSQVPEPISMIFFGTGLVAVSGYIARRRMQR